MAQKYLSVSQLNKYVKYKFDQDPNLNAKVFLTGEISGFRERERHQYFSLKDGESSINANFFQGKWAAFRRANPSLKIEDGLKVFVTGTLSVYIPSGSYSFIIDTLEVDSVGVLYAQFEKMKARLYDEGLFNSEYKKPIKKYPEKIGVVTSRDGAVIHDIITTVKRRYPLVQVYLYPTQVQGEGSAADIAANIARADADGYDTLIIGRGGGSLEDLWSFNEEVVARAIFAAKTPVISSVGHETDTTIADLVADVRAATPTAAAEIATPNLQEELQNVANQKYSMMVYLNKLIENKNNKLNLLLENPILKNPNKIYENKILQFNNIVARLENNSPKNRVENYREKYDNLKRELNKNIINLINNKNNQFILKRDALELSSPLKIMGRGFAYTTDADGKLVKSVKDVKINEKIKVNYADGELLAVVEEINE
ncbi:MAG: exodeoxyribonuclease VII large subunit [Lactobacillales bacterium]|jgi:exodeoxyribonuclease VII large subunit|nr:exodeoxyribonuclease VII large subunit [Lactobacillales bacterium]